MHVYVGYDQRLEKVMVIYICYYGSPYFSDYNLSLSLSIVALFYH